MKRSKNQAVYRFLPEMWISERNDTSEVVTAKIKNWNYRKMESIYDKFIDSEIKRQIRLFENRNGDISAFNLQENTPSFEIVETACIENTPDIMGEISPLVFYCGSCGTAFEKKSAGAVDKYTWRCPECKKNSVKQLQMIYTCECGYAQPIKIPYVKNVKDFKYRPNDNPYKMIYRNGNSEKTAEFIQVCPNCNSHLRPDNASSGKNYKPFTLRIINLVDTQSGKFYEKGLDAQKVLVSKWFDKITPSNFDFILNNVELAFSDEYKDESVRKEAENQANGLIAIGLIAPEKFDETVAQIMKTKSNDKGVERYVTACDELFSKRKSDDPNAYNEWINNFSFKLMQYNTIKDAKRVITLEDSIQRQLDMEFIDSVDEVYDMNKKLGIKNMQVTCDSQIVNCTYGYTRRSVDPSNSTNKNCRLKLNAYDRSKNSNTNLVFGSRLDTEGILFEIDQRKIIEWLLANGVIREEMVPDLDDEISVKKWFAEYVHSDAIPMFGSIDNSEEITKNVYSLLHSMSHAFIESAGEISGLSSNSLTEIIIVETASIFIYAQTSQGIPLGALSGMAESRYLYYLKKTFDESKNCVFDPICTERDDTACSACLILPEISCNHFNLELGRKYLYSIDGAKEIKVGFWEM